MRNHLKINIAGGGIAGLAGAILLARAGHQIALYERAAAFSEVGAGLQVSPNVTRILDRIGVLDRLQQTAVEPVSLLLKLATSGATLTEIPLAKLAKSRWGAPYLTAHRADLHNALLDTASELGSIALNTDVQAQRFSFADGKTVLELDSGNVNGDLLVAADGVWSTLRRCHTGAGNAMFSGHVAWRKTVPADAVDPKIISAHSVTAFFHPAAHMVCYPISGGKEINLAAFTAGKTTDKSWTVQADIQPLAEAAGKWHPVLKQVINGEGAWLGWPIHTVEPKISWTDPRGFALIGDAAHAMTPFSAQGAAMATEDAAVLATCLSQDANDLAAALAHYETLRKPRVDLVRKRGAFNRFTWHAWGPFAFGRNLILRYGPQAATLAGLDSIYGWDEADLHPSSSH